MALWLVDPSPRPPGCPSFAANRLKTTKSPRLAALAGKKLIFAEFRSQSRTTRMFQRRHSARRLHHAHRRRLEWNRLGNRCAARRSSCSFYSAARFPYSSILRHRRLQKPQGPTLHSQTASAANFVAHHSLRRPTDILATAARRRARRENRLGLRTGARSQAAEA